MNSVERVTVTRRGVDVVAEVKRDEGGPLESDVPTPKGVARFRPDGTLDEDFGDDGAVKRVSESTVSFPDGSLADPDTRFSPSGEVVSNPSLPLDLIPGEEVLAPSGASRLVVAGTPRGVTGIRPTVFARLTADGGLDRSFGRGGQVTVPVGSPVDLQVLPGGHTLAAFLGGVVVKLDPTGRPDRSFGREGTATLFARTPPGSIVRIAVGRRDELAAMRVTGGRADVLRLGGDGRPLPSFASRPLRAGGGRGPRVRPLRAPARARRDETDSSPWTSAVNRCRHWTVALFRSVPARPAPCCPGPRAAPRSSGTPGLRRCRAARPRRSRR